MDNEMNRIDLPFVYFSIIGIIATLSGIVQLLVALSPANEYLIFKIIAFPGDLFNGGWGGIVISAGGFFILSGLSNIKEIEQFAKISTGIAILILTGACNLFNLITTSIPGAFSGSDSLFNPLPVFIGFYIPPYSPAIILLIPAIISIHFIKKWQRENEE